MKKAERYRAQKLKIQSNLVWYRDYNRHEKTGADIKDMKREFSTRAPSLPWDREDGNKEVRRVLSCVLVLISESE